MRKLTLIALLTSITFLIVCCVYTTGVAKTETVRGKIEMNLPDVPTPKVVINLDQTFFNLLINFGIASTLKIAGDEPIDMTEYAEMLKGAAFELMIKRLMPSTRSRSTIKASLKTKSGNISSKSRTNSI